MSDALITAKRIVRRNPSDRKYYIYEVQENGSEQRTGRGYPHSTSCYAHLGRMVSNEAEAEMPTDDEKRQSELFEEHCTEATRKKAQFFNLGWAQGEDFIHSKTDQGRLYSQYEKDGSISHRWE